VRAKRSAFDVLGEEQTTLVMNDCRRKTAKAGGLVTDYFVPPVDPNERELVADAGKIRLASGSNCEVAVREPARDGLDRERAAQETKLPKPIDQLSLGAIALPPARKPLYTQRTLPAKLELGDWTVVVPIRRNQHRFVFVGKHRTVSRGWGGVSVNALRSIQGSIILLKRMPTRWSRRHFGSG
jgi:hypothetical protein